MAYCLHPILVADKVKGENGAKTKVYKSYKEVPCGKCLACLERRRNDLAYRMHLESEMSESTFFVTLTYSDEFLPIDCVKGECEESYFSRFNKKHCQDWLKRLRYNLDVYDKIKVRYLLCSEYGTQTFRPHYHAVLFLDKFLTLEQIVQLTEKSWTFGNIQIAAANPARIFYVTKYQLKDSLAEYGFITDKFGKVEYFTHKDTKIAYSEIAHSYLEKPFVLMSNKPGLGYKTSVQYENDMQFKTDTKNPSMVYFDGFQKMMPRYLRDKLHLPSLTSVPLVSLKWDKITPKQEHAFRELYKYDRSGDEFDLFVHKRLAAAERLKKQQLKKSIRKL